MIKIAMMMFSTFKLFHSSHTQKPIPTPPVSISAATITNHAIKKDIVVLVDWWEHAWALDYQADKKKYLENQWKIINWEHVNESSAI